MFLSHIDHTQTYTSLFTDPVWEKAFEWIQQNAATAPEGEQPIDGRNLYVNIIRTETKPRTERVFENHEQYIDLHYCISGGELIEWTPVSTLTTITDQNVEKDYTLYSPLNPGTILHIESGYFAIFLPGDAHMPQIHNGTHEQIHKAVVKIKLDFLK